VHSPADDFDVLWRAVDEGYAYFDGREALWRAARARWRARAIAARTRGELLAALEGVLSELHDEHVTLGEHNALSPRPVPSASDLWGEWVAGDALVVAVRAGSVADAAGIAPGMQVLAIGGQPAEQAVRSQLPRALHSDARARNWALRRLLAGPWAGAVELEVKTGASRRKLAFERDDVPASATPPLVVRRIGEDRELGYLRIKNNLGDAHLVQHFDAALLTLRDTRGLLVDLRETPAGGDPGVARALLGRFTATPSPWIVRRARGDRRGVEAPAEIVEPRGPFTYAAPVAALVDRWTAAEGESLAIGLETAARATLVGTAMAGLHGEARRILLPGSRIAVGFPAARVLHVNGTPREVVRPALAVDLVAPSGGPGDPILYQGLKLLEARPGGSRSRT
jgi:carboxyl-terminal processing protease